MAGNRQVLLKSRPAGRPTPANFEIVDQALPDTGQGEVLRKTLFLSLDPYMRGRMSDAPSYAPPAAIGGVMPGATVSEVIESRNPAFAKGDIVESYDGWQEFAVSNGKGLRKLDPTDVPVTTALGVLGMPGLTAWVGLIDIARPAAGETVVVSAAAGAVGSAAGQLAKIRGCRVVGIAGSASKCRYVADALGFDACVDYKSPEFKAALKEACPRGIDVYFENVGGAVLAAVLTMINRGARIPLCGLISDYNAVGHPPGPNLRPLIVNRATIKGFLVSDHFDRFPEFLKECAPLVRDGRLRYREDIVDGLENAPEALIGQLDGRNFGKLIVRVALR